MPPTWSDVAASPGYQGLAPAAQEDARQAYFEQVVRPRIPSTLDAGQVRAQFFEQTAPKSGPYASTIGAPEPQGPIRSTWNNLKNAWEGAIPGTPQSENPNRSTVSKLASAAVAPVALPAAMLEKAGQAATQAGGQVAQAVGRAVPAVPALGAAAGTAVALGTDPSSWLPGGLVDMALNPLQAARGTIEGARALANLPGDIRRGFQSVQDAKRAAEGAQAAAEAAAHPERTIDVPAGGQRETILKDLQALPNRADLQRQVYEKTGILLPEPRLPEYGGRPAIREAGFRAPGQTDTKVPGFAETPPSGVNPKGAFLPVQEAIRADQEAAQAREADAINDALQGIPPEKRGNVHIVMDRGRPVRILGGPPVPAAPPPPEPTGWQAPAEVVAAQRQAAPVFNPYAEAVRPAVAEGQAGTQQPGVLERALMALPGSRPAAPKSLPGPLAETVAPWARPVLEHLQGRGTSLSEPIPAGLRLNRSVIPVEYGFAQTAADSARAVENQYKGVYSAILKHGGVDAKPFPNPTPEMELAWRASESNLPHTLPPHPKLTNAEVFSLAADGPIRYQGPDGRMHTVQVNPASLPPQMQEALQMHRLLESRIYHQLIGGAEQYELPSHFTHVWDNPQSLAALQQQVPETGAFLKPEENGRIVSDPFLKHRLGAKGYSKDPRQAFAAYIHQALRKVAAEPVSRVLGTWGDRGQEVARDLGYTGKAENETMGKAYTQRIRQLQDAVEGKPDAGYARADVVLSKLSKGYLAPGSFAKGEAGLANAAYTSLVGASIRTALSEPPVRIGNVGAQEGAANAAKGAAKGAVEWVMHKLDPSFQTAAGRLNMRSATEDLIQNGIALSENNKGIFRTFAKMTRAAQWPLKQAMVISNGMAEYAALERARELARLGKFPDDERALKLYMAQAPNFTVGRGGSLNRAPWLNKPLTKLLNVLTTFTQNQAAFFWDRLARNPAQAKIMGVPAGVIRIMAFLGLSVAAKEITGADTTRRAGPDLSNKLPGEGYLPGGVGTALHMVPGLMPTYELAQAPTSNPFSGPLLSALMGTARFSNPEDASRAFNSGLGTAEMLAGGAAGIPVLAAEQAADRLHELLTGWNAPYRQRPDQYLIPGLQPQQETWRPVSKGQAIGNFLGFPSTP